MTWYNVGLIRTVGYLIDNQMSKCTKFVCEVCVAYLFSFLCCVFSFVCLRPVSCVHYVASFSVLSIIDCPFSFLIRLFTTSFVLTWQYWMSDLHAFMIPIEYNWRHTWCKTTRHALKQEHPPPTHLNKQCHKVTILYNIINFLWISDTKKLVYNELPWDQLWC